MHRMLLLQHTVLTLFLANCAGHGSARNSRDQKTEPDLSNLFGDTVGTFTLYDKKNDDYLRYNSERAATRFSPCSTFKIANTLIALETGILENADSVITWDKEKYPKETWWDEILAPRGYFWDRDHSLKTAFKQSVVWYYREVAKRIGQQRMDTFLEQFDYGNQDTSDGIDLFWLTGSLKISADEQVEFLRKFYKGALGLTEKTTRIAKQVFLQETGDGYKLFGKTGTSNGEGGAFAPIGWYVGYVERGDNVGFFAFNMTGKIEEILKRRDTLTRTILQDLGLLPRS